MGDDGSCAPVPVSGTVTGSCVFTRSTTLVGATPWLNRYESTRLDTKNSVASTAVVRERNEAEPREPNTVPEAPAPISRRA